MSVCGYFANRICFPAIAVTEGQSVLVSRNPGICAAPQSVNQNYRFRCDIQVFRFCIPFLAVFICLCSDSMQEVRTSVIPPGFPLCVPDQFKFSFFTTVETD